MKFNLTNYESFKINLEKNLGYKIDKLRINISLKSLIDKFVDFFNTLLVFS